jgi:signal transduction histidine kinase
VIQEALTNVLKHAAASHVVITVAHGPTALTIEVVDDGAGPSPAAPARPLAGAGHGLAGMAERVRAHGGTVETGHLTPQGFRVLARLPTATSTAAAPTAAAPGPVA